MSKSPRIAVLGSGIMGSSTALLLARRGATVTLFDAAAQPFSGASRWNEGKIHLGFLYNADPTLQTTRRILPGGLTFKPLTEQLIGCSLAPATTAGDDIYLCHRASVVQPEAMRDYFRQAAELIRQHPDARRYLVDVSDCRTERLAASELDAISGSPDIVAGYRVPERSVATRWVADRFVSALSAEPRIEQRMATRVTAVCPRAADEPDGQWLVDTTDGSHGPYDFIVNALWEGRLAIDLSAGLKPQGNWSNRFRLALFIRTSEPVDVPSAIITTGPFGDMKNYNGRDFYLSWYPKGLVADSNAISPPARPVPDQARTQEISTAVLDSLAALLPGTARISRRIESLELEGGWVHAAGQGALSDPGSTLHRRTDFGIARLGSYLSVDTGKYSTAPWLAHKVADGILPKGA